MVPNRSTLIRTLHTAAWLVMLSFVPLSSAAQAPDAVPAPPHLAVVDGEASLERDARVEQAVADMPVVVGDRIKTSGGRAEVLFADGSALDIDDGSIIDLQSDTLLRLSAGHVVLTVAGASDPANARRYQVDTPAGSAQTFGPGEYRITVFSGTPTQTELDVVRGSGTLANESGSVALDAGLRSVAPEDGPPSYAEAFNSARLDDFDTWVGSQRDSRLGSASAQYLPPDLQAYGGTFDQDGAWDYMEPYGYVWYPTVAASWRPYYHGYWSPIRQYGWTWIGLDRWAWPTHHFGRWGYSRGSWFWVPSRSWSPAWVAWSAAPGYVGWCPLGLDGGPVFSLSARLPDTWHGWTVMPRNAFGYSLVGVARHAVAPEQLHLETTPFIEQRVSPVAVPRHPIAVAVRRDPSGVQEREVSPRVPATVDGRSRRTRPATPPVAAPASAAAPTLEAAPRAAAPSAPHPVPAPLASPTAVGPPPAGRSAPVAVPRAVVPPAPQQTPGPAYRSPVTSAPPARLTQPAAPPPSVAGPRSAPTMAPSPRPTGAPSPAPAAPRPVAAPGATPTAQPSAPPAAAPAPPHAPAPQRGPQQRGAAATSAPSRPAAGTGQGQAVKRQQ